MAVDLRVGVMTGTGPRRTQLEADRAVGTKSDEFAADIIESDHDHIAIAPCGTRDRSGRRQLLTVNHMPRRTRQRSQIPSV